MPSEKSAGAVVFHKAANVEYLLLHYPAGHWDFPKGNIEAGETEQAAALREIKEETGLAVRLVDGFRAQMQYFFHRQGATVNKTVVFFLAEAPGGAVRISPEHQGFAWLRYREALAKITFGNAKQLLEQAEAFLATAGSG